MSNDILSQAEAHVSSLLQTRLPSWAVYHNLAHTEQTVNAVREIGEGVGLNKPDMELALLAAWFHDTGYIDTIDGHEERSAQIAAEFLRQLNTPESTIEKAVSCIQATKIPQQPHTLAEQVVCDADIIHLGKKRFFERSALLRMEMELRTGTTFTDREWLQKNVDFASGMHFFTEYARKEFGGRRRKNLIMLQEQLRGEIETATVKGKKQEEKQARLAEKREKESKPERGIETMFRVVPKNHLDLTALADHKSNILIGTNGTILAIVVSLLVRHLDTNPHLVIPTMILIAVSVTTMVFAILATRPNVNSGQFTREDIRDRKVNLLFFGNFHKSTLEDFDWGMREMMNDKDYLYGSMIKDLYFLGKVLGVKYRLLRIAYTIFMWGLIVSVIAFAIAILMTPAPMAFPAQ